MMDYCGSDFALVSGIALYFSSISDSLSAWENLMKDAFKENHKLSNVLLKIVKHNTILQLLVEYHLISVNPNDINGE